MATFQNPARRLILAGGFAVAIAAAPAVAVFAVPTTSTPAPVAQCQWVRCMTPPPGCVCQPRRRAACRRSRVSPAPVPTRVNALAWARSSSRRQLDPASARRPLGPLVDPGARLGGQRFAAFGQAYDVVAPRRARRSAAPARLGRQTAPDERR